ncbi:RNA polymerase subunit sigma [bacterium]|nr:MAG: RNA polymerase subunit sigma [bacterium]
MRVLTAQPAGAGAESFVSEHLMAEPVERSDAVLVRRSQAGDTRAFGELVERYMRRAYYGALGLVGSPDDAMDLSQEAFARAFRFRDKLDPDRPFYAWLYQILRRLCFNFVRDRRNNRRKLTAAAPYLVGLASARHSGANPDKALERSEARRRVRAAIESLSDRDREVLVLKEFEGLRYREIAELVGIPIGTVMSRLYEARRRLAAALEERS